MYSKDFELLLDGNWQPLPVEGFFVALQIENTTSGNVEIKMEESATVTRILESGAAAEWRTTEIKEPFRNAGIQVKGVNGQTLKGERWIYDYQKV